MTLRLYLDEDSMARALVEALRARGLDVETALDADRIGHLDEAHLSYATQQRRALLTANARDFCRLHGEVLARGENHSGIIIGKQSYGLGEAARRLLRLSASLSSAEMEGRLEFLSNW